jgi:pilus assembly protein CpaF
LFSLINKQETKPREKIGKVDLKKATQIVQEIIQDPSELSKETAEKHKQILIDTMAGVSGAREQTLKIVQGILQEYGVEPEGISLEDAAYEIYKYAWGLGPIEEIYHDPNINEIRVNAPDRVYVLRNMRNEKTDIKFRDEEHVSQIITRITMHDRGVGLNKSSPTIESMRKDGTRITATCPPVSEHFTFVLRKHFSKVLTPDDLLKSGTLDEKTWNILRLLVKGRANILVAGGVGSGKTTLVRSLFSAVDPAIRTIVIETDSELFLSSLFKERDIIELEEHPEADRTLDNLFRIVLRYSPSIIIVGEFRGAGEAKEAVRACLRGHSGSFATAHFGSPQEAIEGTAKLQIEEGLNLPLEVAVSMVASAYNIVIQMFGDATRGVIKVESVTEVVAKGTEVEYRDLVRWVPSGDDYLVGEWEIKNKPTERLIKRMFRYGLTRDDLKEVGW